MSTILEDAIMEKKLRIVIADIASRFDIDHKIIKSIVYHHMYGMSLRHDLRKSKNIETQKEYDGAYNKFVEDINMIIKRRCNEKVNISR